MAPMKLLARVVAAELTLTLGEAVLCGVPVARWLNGLAEGERLARVPVPVALALWVALVLTLARAVAPAAAVMAAAGAKTPIGPEARESAARGLAHVARDAGLRLLFWMALVTALAVLVYGDSTVSAGVVSVVLFHAIGMAAVRWLAFDHILAPVRPVVMPALEGVAVFAARYRTRVWLVALAVLGGSHAFLALGAMAFSGALLPVLARSGTLLWPPLIVSAFLWSRSLLRRTAPLERYFDATLRAAGGQGPSREDPGAVSAFVVGQSLPYRMALYQAFSFGLSGVVAIAAARHMTDLAVASAARLLAVVALVSVAVAVGQAVALRQVFLPLTRHIGSRHLLPVEAVRSRLGLGPKLAAAFSGAIFMACVTLALYMAARDSPWALPALGVGITVAMGLGLAVIYQVVAPLRALQAHTSEMAQGDIVRPAPPVGEADEIGLLVVAFEHLRRSLRDRLRSTESINIDLEREVHRRTETLEQRNAELREALEKLRRAQDSLVRGEKLASMGRLVAGVAHEVNNPVNAVLNSLGPLEETLGKMRATPSKDAHLRGLLRSSEDMVRVIQRGAARIKAIVQALHNYSRRDEAVEREVNLGRCIEETIDLLRHRLHDVQVVCRVDESARIYGFPGQIGQVLMNLLVNAAQAIGERGTITVDVAVVGDTVEVSVRDDGAGIPEDVLPRIFDPFFTTKDVGEGSGLGLAIVQGIVESHKGQIGVDSRVGRGTTVRMTFPRFTVVTGR
jgi:signal transduction histidine kinase